MTWNDHLIALNRFYHRYVMRTRLPLPGVRNTVLVFQRQIELREEMIHAKVER